MGGDHSQTEDPREYFLRCKRDIVRRAEEEWKYLVGQLEDVIGERLNSDSRKYCGGKIEWLQKAKALLARLSSLLKLPIEQWYRFVSAHGDAQYFSDQALNGTSFPIINELHSLYDSLEDVKLRLDELDKQCE